MIASMGEETVVKKMFKNFVYDILNLVSANLVFSKLLKSWQTQSRITLSNILCVTTGFKNTMSLKINTTYLLFNFKERMTIFSEEKVCLNCMKV